MKVYVYNIDLLPIMFPEYRISYGSYGLYVGPGQLYLGGCVEKPMFDDGAIEPVQYVSKDVVSFPDRESVLKFVHDKKGVKLRKGVVEKVKRHTEDRFIKELRIFMAVGRWLFLDDGDSKIYKLFRSFALSSEEFLLEYFAMRDKLSYEEVCSYIMGFLSRCSSYDPGNNTISEYYKSVIESFLQFRGYRELPYKLLKDWSELRLVFGFLSLRREFR